MEKVNNNVIEIKEIVEKWEKIRQKDANSRDTYYPIVVIKNPLL